MTYSAPAYREPAHRQMAAILRARAVRCAVCQVRRATTVGHSPALALHYHVAGSGCCALRPECVRCNMGAGGRIAGEARAAVKPSRRW